MSDIAYEQFDFARREQLTRNEARRMLTFVKQARGNTNIAGARWPFELTQNAQDPGPRDGGRWVNIHLSFDGQTVIYEHDGKPFSMQDLAALLSGGSSKEFDAVDTTGRFGSGFLVTHVLSPQITFQGILATSDGYEKVEITLDRGGDEKQIFENTVKSSEAIKNACRLPALDGHKTARFEYRTDNADAAATGIAAFTATLPYLYATCEHLGVVRIFNESRQEILFEPQVEVVRENSGVHIRERQIAITQGDAKPVIINAIRIRRRAGSVAGLVVTNKKVTDGWHVCIPPSDFERLFCRFPIRGSDFIPVNAIIDGRFELHQERDRVLMGETDKKQISEALGLLPTLVEVAKAENWQDAHRLARVGMAVRHFGDKLEEPLKSWWQNELSVTAGKLARMPIVRTTSGFRCAIDGNQRATFVLPRFDVAQKQDEVDFPDVWALAGELRGVFPPAAEIGQDWVDIASEWSELGVAVHRMALSEIAQAVRSGITSLVELKVTTDPLEWLARFLNLVGKVAARHNCTKLLINLLPDQNMTLKPPVTLARDTGISEELKNIARAIGIDVRSRLLHKGLVAHTLDEKYVNLKELLDSQIGRSLDEQSVIKECIDELSRQLPDNKKIAADKKAYRDASIDLLKYLWDGMGTGGAEYAQKCPLISTDETAIRWSTQRKTLAPVSLWQNEARPFAQLYKDDRILSQDYITRADESRVLVDALVAWGLAFADPLCEDAPRELRDERLKAMAVEGEDCLNAVVADVPFSQIAHLPNEIIQRCQSDKEAAGLLLGLVLNHVAPHDSSWKDVRAVQARRERKDIQIKVHPALWLSDLKTKAWVPERAEKGIQPMFANAGNLKSLLEPAWLRGNDEAIELLSKHFGFSALELRLLSTVPEGDRGRVENGLAKIVQLLGNDPAGYNTLAESLIAQRQRIADKERNRRFGLGVQKAIEKYLAERKLHPKLIDRGYDYDLFVDDPNTIDAGTHHFVLADYMLEVKATTTGEVRLTPLQAQMSSEHPKRFILCVVDLRDLTPSEIFDDAVTDDIEQRARVAVGIGHKVVESRDLVLQAKGCEIGIRNETALRYGVPVKVWEEGLSLSGWVASLHLADEQT